MSFTLTPPLLLSESCSLKWTGKPCEILIRKEMKGLMFRFTQADVRPFAENILMALFSNIEKGGTPEKIAENDYLMKCELQ